MSPYGHGLITVIFGVSVAAGIVVSVTFGVSVLVATGVSTDVLLVSDSAMPIIEASNTKRNIICFPLNIVSSQAVYYLNRSSLDDITLYT